MEQIILCKLAKLANTLNTCKSTTIHPHFRYTFLIFMIKELVNTA